MNMDINILFIQILIHIISFSFFSFPQLLTERLPYKLFLLDIESF